MKKDKKKTRIAMECWVCEKCNDLYEHMTYCRNDREVPRYYNGVKESFFESYPGEL